MHARTPTAILFVAAAALMLAVAPSEAQAPPTTPTAPPAPAVKKQPAAPAKVTVRRRSFLDPGTETKTHQEHDRDYAFPPGDHSFGVSPNDFRVNYTRSPFPSCFDLPHYCR
jgi:hypothetical protein